MAGSRGRSHGGRIGPCPLLVVRVRHGARSARRRSAGLPRGPGAVGAARRRADGTNRPATRRVARGTTAGAGGGVGFRGIAYREELAGAGAAGRRCWPRLGRGVGAGERRRPAARRPHQAALRPGVERHPGEALLAARGREDGRPRSRCDREGGRGRRSGGCRPVSPQTGTIPSWKRDWATSC